MKNPICLINNWLHKYGLFGWNYAYLFTHPWIIVEESYYHMKWFLQRGWRGYGDNDIWNLNWYLTKWMPQVIRKLHNTKGCHPCGMTYKGWITRLEKLEDGFVAAREIQEMKHAFKSIEEREAYRRFHCGMKLFHEHFFSLWD